MKVKEKLFTGHVCGKKLLLTMPIINVGFGFLRQGLCIFMRSQNLWDFALDNKK